MNAHSVAIGRLSAMGTPRSFVRSIERALHLIFVAHNVNFDYGFISQEYTRLERQFRFPKFCTCAGMRRHYPGHRSYSLGSLCDIYEISLEHHHRALCDAEAAAKLLNLINRKRDRDPMRDAA